MAAVAELSDYYFSLQDVGVKKRYKQKITLFKGQDPYLMTAKKQLNQTPDFRYCYNNYC